MPWIDSIIKENLCVYFSAIVEDIFVYTTANRQFLLGFVLSGPVITDYSINRIAFFWNEARTEYQDYKYESQLNENLRTYLPIVYTIDERSVFVDILAL